MEQLKPQVMVSKLLQNYLKIKYKKNILMQNISDEKHTQAITRRTHTRTTEKHKGLSGLGQMFIKTDPQ